MLCMTFTNKQSLQFNKEPKKEWLGEDPIDRGLGKGRGSRCAHLNKDHHCATHGRCLNWNRSSSMSGVLEMPGRMSWPVTLCSIQEVCLAGQLQYAVPEH